MYFHYVPEFEHITPAAVQVMGLFAFHCILQPNMESSEPVHVTFLIHTWPEFPPEYAVMLDMPSLKPSRLHTTPAAMSSKPVLQT